MGHVAVMTGTGMVGLMALFLVDALNLFYISMLGQTALAAAIGFAGTVQFFTISVSIGLAIAATALVSRAVGEGDRAEARRLAASSLVLLLGALTLVSLGVWIWREAALAALGAKGETLAVASRFLAIVLPSLPLLGAGMIASSLLRSIGDARRAMFVTLSGGAVGAALDPLLIFGFGLGVDGAAITSLVARAVIAAMGFRGAMLTHDLVARPNAADIVRHAPGLMRIAGPAVATQLSTPTGLAALTAAMAAFGDAAVAGWAVVGRMTALAFGGVFALSGAVGPILGQNLGAGLTARVRSAYRDAVLFCAVYVLSAWALLALARPWIVSGFGLDGAGVAVVDAFVYAGAGFYVFTGGLFVANAAFNTLGRPLWATALNWSRDALVLPVLALTLPPLMGAEGVVAAQALAALVVGGVGGVIGWRMAPRLADRHAARRLAAEAPAFASGRAAALAVAAEPDWRPENRDDR
ncbi:putative efflux protein, MATE family [Rubrimonas cliftonensis]|uniref:Putative efflux protein, MATE family n=2 Tax=Rubrimonas cliftonensis TaxID=89524 RepID=A0A1H3ZAR0_9RHOB|nr:putative efflux protein, MATE family [Rubrimonas cliftonensis]